MSAIDARSFLQWLQKGVPTEQEQVGENGKKRNRHARKQQKRQKKLADQAKKEDGLDAHAARLRKLAMGTDSGLPELRDLCAKLKDLHVEETKPIDTRSDAGKTALQMAGWRGTIQIVDTLLASGADINLWSTGPHNYGKTAIFYAITRGRDDMVMALLERGANVCIVNNKVRGVPSGHLSVSNL